MVAFTWTPEQSAVLKSLLSAGLAYSEIAKTINEQFGVSFTRNAAIGRATRMGLVCPDKPKAPPKPRKPSQHRMRERYDPNSRRIMPIFESTGVIQLRCVEIVPRHLSLIDLEPGDCRYAYGEGPFTFCAHPKLATSSYCGPHHALVWVKPAPPKHKAFIREAA